MGNGGGDCCAMCLYNAKNKGRYQPPDVFARDAEPDYCTVRGVLIDTPSPYYTYCANHFSRRRERDPIPVGPVFIGDSNGDREVWQPSPDTEDIRLHLLALLAEVNEQPRPEYPAGWHTWQVVVWQLGEFREHRAVEELQRVAAWRPRPQATGHEGVWSHLVTTLPRMAQEALEKILAPASQRREGDS